MSGVTLRGFDVTRGGRAVVSGVDLDLPAGLLVCLVGPNGAGKTTLMRGALGLLPATGETSLARLGAVPRARRVAWLPQRREIAWPVSVEEVVALGRAPWRGAGRLAPSDRRAVDAAIARLGLDALRHRDASRLSGGEQTRVLIARTVAQETPVLFADEPVAGLDPHHQLAVMAMFRDLAREGRAVFVSIHDLGLAARYCDRLVVLDHGRVAAEGPPWDVLRSDTIDVVFGIRATVHETAAGPVFRAAAREDEHGAS